MNLKFTGALTQEMLRGITCLAPELGYTVSDDGMVVHAIKAEVPTLSIEKNANQVTIIYDRPCCFYRALGLLAEHKNETAFAIAEKPQFETLGAMYDVCQGNAVINVEHVKNILRKMAIMGHNMFMLYAEDSYDIPEEPYFGYMRSRYSDAEMREIDDYAYDLGIEVIPCMQTLAHLMDVLKWAPYKDFSEDDDTLLVGDEKTYAFIDHMITAASKPFRSKRIHIGMDEAWKLGQGQYLLRNGFKPKHQIMHEHLERVLEIVRSHGLEPMIWSDMFLRSISKTGGYYDRTSVVTEDLRRSVPKDLSLVYWDYYHFTEEEYDYFIKKHIDMSGLPIFAGGIWTWQGYAATYDITVDSTNCALNVCKRLGVKEAFATVWGDSATEANVYTTLLGLQLFAEHGYSETEPTKAQVTARFKACTGCDYDDFYKLTYFDKLDRTWDDKFHRYGNPSKWMMWQDILCGQFDKDIEEFDLDAHFAWLRGEMAQAKDRGGEFAFLFDFYEKTADVLSIKAGLGNKLLKAYKAGDRETLTTIQKELLPSLREKLDDLRRCHMNIWMDINKPLGWEVMDIRYGGVLARIDSIMVRLGDYLSGAIASLPELEEERRYYHGEKKEIINIRYVQMPSASRLSYLESW